MVGTARIIERDAAVRRPMPRLDGDNRAFWTSGEQGVLAMMGCGDCGRFTHPPKRICRHCQSEEMTALPVAGTGTIDTFTINHQPWLPGLEVPFVIARVALDDVPGVYLTTNIVGSPVENIAIGDRVRVLFEKQDDVYFPVFEKVAPAA